MRIAAITGDSKAFAYVRRTQSVAPPGDIVRNRDAAREEWKAIWQGTDHAADGLPELECLKSIPMIKDPAPTPDQIRRASRAFSAKTTAADEWPPRIFQYLTDAQLLPLCWIFSAWEFLGVPALPCQQLMVKMIPKPVSGYRPIGLFPTPYRL